jgi:MerR family transcriptional regulator, thiopeptide resistance regulator
MISIKMIYTVKQLAGLAGISVRTLHYYDDIGLLKPEYRSPNGYRQYGEDAIARLQQIMFFRDLDFSLDEIGKMLSQPGFDALEALKSHKVLLSKRADRIHELQATVDRTIKNLKGEGSMEIKEYYQGFSEDQIEKYRDEVRRKWGEKTLKDSEERVKKMGKEKFSTLQAEGGKIFQIISDNMAKGFGSGLVQAQVAKWREWLENFHHYADEAVLGLGQVYSQDPRFAKFFGKYNKDLPAFLTQAIEYYCAMKK